MTMQILYYDFIGPVQIGQWGPPMEEVVYILLSRHKDTFSMVYVDQCTKSDDPGFFTKNPQFKCWLSHAGSEKNLYLAIHPMFKTDESRRFDVVRKIISKYSPPCNAEHMQDTSRPHAPPDSHAGTNRAVDTATDAVDDIPARDTNANAILDADTYAGTRTDARTGTARTPDAADETASHKIHTKSASDHDFQTGTYEPINCACCGSMMRAEQRLRQSTLYRCIGCGTSNTRLD